MTKDEILEYLIQTKQILFINDQYFPKESPKCANPVKLCKNLPEKYIGVSVSKAYDYFLNDCNIPLNSTGNFIYLLRSKTKESESILKKEILENPDIDYLVLTSNIKTFYANPKSTKYPVDKLLSQGFWKGFLATTLSNTERPENQIMR